MQIGQTELIMPIQRHYQVTRRRTWVRREAKAGSKHKAFYCRNSSNDEFPPKLFLYFNFNVGTKKLC